MAAGRHRDLTWLLAELPGDMCSHPTLHNGIMATIQCARNLLSARRTGSLAANSLADVAAVLKLPGAGLWARVNIVIGVIRVTPAGATALSEIPSGLVDWSRHDLYSRAQKLRYRVSSSDRCR